MDTLFTPIVAALQNNAGVSLARMFGSDGLKVNGKVFAMLVRGNLVVKLPKERVDALINAKLGEYFDPGHGRLMKEWVAIKPKAADQWLKLAKEAQRFVVSGL
jgi:TfoX/Sxy family transcriptional regulator of competence genes